MRPKQMTRRGVRARSFVWAASAAGRVPFWRVALVLIVAVALALALAILVSGLFLILLPAIVVGGLVLRFMGQRGIDASRAGPEVIEGEYEVIDDRAGGGAPSDKNRRDP